MAASPPRWQTLVSNTQASLRGLAVVNRAVAWASGTGGVWLRTEDGGAHWRTGHPAGAERLDFRGVVAFSARRAVLMSSGLGAASRIYTTRDGGQSWRRAWQASAPAAFLDGIAFWDGRRGLAIGDPVAGRFLVLATKDGGAHWRTEPAGLPPALANEGVFAASNSALALAPGGRAWFVTGGAAAARVFTSRDYGRHWRAAALPLASGAARGAFSIAVCGGGADLAVVGGDYQQPRQAESTAAFSRDGGRSWQAARVMPPDGYMSAVACVPGVRRELLALGPLGTDISHDGGRTWAHFAAAGGNALVFPPRANRAFAAGARGYLARLRRSAP
ncbi:MAG TPA: glycosyl hydrolase [Terriglobales bacterium]|nr:glycosyl hydrolase [Terriglobales bacterium]